VKLRYLLMFVVLCLISACGTVATPETNSSEAIESEAETVALSETFTSEDSDIDFSFSYPEGWGVRDESSVVYVYSDEAIVEASDDQVFTEGEQAFQVIITGEMPEEVEEATATALAELVGEQLSGEFEASEVTELTVNGHSAARVDLDGEESELTVVIIELNGDDDIFGIVYGLNAPGERAAFEPIVMAVAETITLVEYSRVRYMSFQIVALNPTLNPSPFTGRDLKVCVRQFSPVPFV
jgi:hypothetical protein